MAIDEKFQSEEFNNDSVEYADMLEIVEGKVYSGENIIIRQAFDESRCFKGRVFRYKLSPPFGLLSIGLYIRGNCEDILKVTGEIFRSKKYVKYPFIDVDNVEIIYQNHKQYSELNEKLTEAGI